VREPMSERWGRLPSVVLWVVISLLVAVLVICLLGSAIELMVHAPEQAGRDFSERFFY